ncbi:recombinase family protein [Streptomyces mirabilis]|uniref:recombinase family protein n=1 Tax=Streptomyces mirabilis TaxID=68239 RepID=UPI00369F6131
MPGTPKRVGIYCRLSYAPDGSLEKVERQEADCRQLAQRLNWPVSEAHIFPDNSRSAWQRHRHRPQWERMLKAIEAGEIDAVIVYHGDRLIRQPFDLEKLINIADQKGLRVASPSGTRNLDNPDDRFILRIEAAQACRESDNTSRRVKRGNAARAGKGLPSPGGKRSFGFEKDRITRREEECAILAECADKIVAGLGTAGAVRWMNSTCRTTQGGQWTIKTLVHLLRSPRVAGLIERDGILCEAVWKAIIPVETWEAVKACFDSSTGAHPYQGNTRKHLLSGVARCGCCGGLVKVKPSSGKKKIKDPERCRLYYCPFCMRIGRNTHYTDLFVGAAAVRALNDRRYVQEIHNADPASSSLSAQIASLERRRRETKRQLEELADNPDVDPGLAVLALSSFDRKLADLRARLADASGAWALDQLVGISEEGWKRAPVDLKSAAVQRMFEVTILPAPRPGPGFDPDSVRVVRRPLRTAEDAGLDAENGVDDHPQAQT